MLPWAAASQATGRAFQFNRNSSAPIVSNAGVETFLVCEFAGFSGRVYQKAELFVCVPRCTDEHSVVLDVAEGFIDI